MSGGSYSDYERIFVLSLKMGCAKPAETLFPYVKNISSINLTDIISMMLEKVSNVDDNDEIPTILQSYLDVFKLLENIHYTMNITRFTSNLFYLIMSEYNTYGKHPLYKQIIEIVFRLYGKFVDYEEISCCISDGYNGGIYLLENMNLLTEHDMSGVLDKYTPSGGFLKILEIFMKYQWLSNDNLSDIFRRFFYLHRYSNESDRFSETTDNFIDFIIKYNFCVKIDGYLLSNIWNYNILSKILSLDTEHFVFHVDHQLVIPTASKETYDLLITHGYNAFRAQ